MNRCSSCRESVEPGLHACPFCEAPMAEPPRSKIEIATGTGLGLTAVLVLAFIVAFGVILWTRGHRCSNERSAGSSIKVVATAEMEFRASDRDGNGVHDYWTGDVAGLYAIEAGGQPIRLIQREMALADFDPTPGLATEGTDRYPPLRGQSSAYRGYWYITLTENLQVAAEGGDGRYARESKFHPTRFGFAQIPAPRRANRNKVYMICEDLVLYKRTFDGSFDRKRPLDMDLRRSWIRMD